MESLLRSHRADLGFFGNINIPSISDVYTCMEASRESIMRFSIFFSQQIGNITSKFFLQYSFETFCHIPEFFWFAVVERGGDILFKLKKYSLK